MAFFRRGAVDSRRRRRTMGRILRNLWPPTYHDLRRLHNALRCTWSQNRVSVDTQPFYAQIEPTTACNLQCRFCVYSPTPDRRKDFLSYEQFASILDSLPELLIINLQGTGEPTLNKDLFRMAEEARRRKIYVFTVTNLNISERMVHMLAESSFNEVNFSMESVDPERYEWFRRGGSFALLEKNLRLLAELKKENEKGFPTMGIWTTLTAATVDASEEIFRFAKKSEVVERIQFVFLTDKDSYVQGYEDNLKTQIFVDREETAGKVRELLGVYSRRYGIAASLVEGRCGWPWSGIWVNAEGLLAPCCNIKEYRNPLWGDIASGSLDKVFSSPNWVRVREGLLSGAPHKACRGCPYLG